MLRNLAIASLLFIAAPISVHAADADFCYTAAHPSGAALADSHTVFNCPVAGKHTVSELAKAGWEPVQIDQVMAPSPAGSKSALGSQEQERLLIEKK